MSDLSDEALMEKVQRGETAHLELLVARYQRPLYNYALRVLRETGAAEDAFQETFLRIFQKRASYRAGAPFRPWLYQICLNLCRDQLRRQTRRPEAELKDEIPVRDPNPGPEALSTGAEMTEKIRRAIDQLPDKHRDVFILHYYQNMPYPDIADILEIPVGTVKSRMFHATKSLAELLREFR
jgi:RNA polymerase sigma-70 factor (ECF subfamily)